ncbi:YkuS family protein [Sediminibacillus massiliensis]|uniref:YkuS family protein n=1 Tax=Sediminibacillus massiliensis TaxID=1926277 RepID=UPI001FEC2240|nr:YkuS family protein [Sediminibacillus massiliensis]
MVRIAVEEPFKDVKQKLINKGYEAEMLQRKVDAVDFDCCVVRDKEDLADLHMNVPLVEAKGRSVKKIVTDVETRLLRTGAIDKKASSNFTAKGLFSGIAVGSIVGATAGLLLAPKNGKDLRDDLNGKMNQAKEQTNNLTGKVKEMKPGKKKEDNQQNENELVVQEEELPQKV